MRSRSFAAALAVALLDPAMLSTFIETVRAALPVAPFTERLAKIQKRAQRGFVLSVGAG